jgi:hypothetical protein
MWTNVWQPEFVEYGLYYNRSHHCWRIITSAPNAEACAAVKHKLATPLAKHVTLYQCCFEAERVKLLCRDSKGKLTVGLTLSLCLINWGPRHEDVWGSGGTAPTFFVLGTRSQDSSVGIATGSTARVRFRAETRFVYAAQRPDRLWGPNQPPIQWAPEAVSLRVKELRLEADHWPPSIAEVKKDEAISPVYVTFSWRNH